MRRLDVKEFLDEYVNGYPIFPSNFPMKLDRCYMFDFTGSTNRGENVSESQITIVSRSPNIDEAEGMSLDLKKKLNKLTNVDIGDTNVILIEAIGKHADFGGEDKNKRYYFQLRYRLLLDDKITE